MAKAYNMEMKPGESLEKYYRRLAKVADQRLIRLEELSGVEGYGNAKQWAYKRAMRLVINKYTGRGGKGGSNDSMPEFYAFVRKALDDANVNWQSSELGKVDQGGGGTIAYILGNYNMYVIDAGIPVLNMHAPMEIVSKVDVYEAYLGYKAFLVA